MARSADGMTKHYLYGFGTNSAGQPVIAGPHKDFEGHHVSSGQTFAVNSMFAQSPFRKSN
ncbi:MAG: hypothetical protein JSR73_10090 [Proteobacteria bacterium]|nr:hypothetical protein [Pseudomonadota bacterium]